MVPQLLKYLLASGSMEYKSAREEKGILHGDEKELEEPLLANLLHGKVPSVFLGPPFQPLSGLIFADKLADKSCPADSSTPLLIKLIH